MIKQILILISIVAMASSSKGQSFWFGAKAGIGLNSQKWNSFDRNILLTPLGDIFIESYDEDEVNTLYAQGGFHTRGSSVRFNTFQSLSSITEGFKFNNLVLELGARHAFGDKNDKFRLYYILGIRGEYTLSTNLDDFLVYDPRYFPLNDFVNKINYGATFGGGYEWKADDYQKIYIELSVNPDFSYQYEQPPITNVKNPFTNNLETLPQRLVRNLSFEIKVGMKFLRKVTYID
jgi:hypothetical protein